MSETFTIRANEHGLIRVFVVDLPKREIDGFDVAHALGPGALDPAQVELFDLSDIGEIGLSGYMNEGLGIAPDELDAPRLDALSGPVLILRSAAFRGQAVTLTPKAPLRWIGTYAEQTTPVKFEPLPAGKPENGGASEPKTRPSDAAMSGRVAMTALLVIFALTALMVWVAG